MSLKHLFTVISSGLTAITDRHHLHAVWDILGHDEAFASFLFGSGHDVPDYCRDLTVAWLDRWLVDV